MSYTSESLVKPTNFKRFWRLRNDFSRERPDCDFFWTWTAVAVVMAFALIGLYIVRKMAKNFLAVRAERRRLAEASRVADPVTMSRYRVDPEKFHPDPPQQEGIERRIRQALDEKKLEQR